MGLVLVEGSLDHEAREEHVIEVIVSDAEGLTDWGLIRVLVRDVNERPTLLSNSGNVAENAPLRTRVGSAMVATDSDRGQTLIFDFPSPSEADGKFRINACSGQVEVLRGANFEHIREYNITVRVTDDGEPKLLYEGGKNKVLCVRTTDAKPRTRFSAH